jgi:hypothetical protein
MDCIDLAQNRDRWCAVLNVVMNLQVSKNMGNFLSRCRSVSISGRALFDGIS